MSRDLLTAVRARGPGPETPIRKILTDPAVKPTGAMGRPLQPAPAGAIRVAPGESMQEALDPAAGRGFWVVVSAGVHKLPRTLKVPRNVRLAGEGLSSVLGLDPASEFRDAFVGASPDLWTSRSRTW